MIKKFLLLIIPLFSLLISYCQTEFKFAHVSDTHIGSNNSEEDLRRTVANINNDSTLKFVILSGDITDFGSDSEFYIAKRILDSLNKPWHIIPGNHDANWSESGTNSFKKIFGSETFKFKYGGYLFIGTVCGPNMRMSPGQVSRENVVWLDSTLTNLKDKSIPIIYVNHYPQDTSLNNWYEIIDLLKKRNTQLIICGHGHANHILNFEGIPGIMGRSNLRAKKPVGGYNIVTIKDGTVTYEERNPVTNEQKEWAHVSLFKHDFKRDTTHYFRPSYSVNKTYKNVKVAWQFNDKSDIGSGVALTKNLVIASNSNGLIYALNINTGKKVWSYATKGKIYSTPAVENNLAVVASTDDNIYCLNSLDGKLVWKYETQKPIVANPLIKDGVVYIGSGDGHFRALHLQSGKLKWEFDSVKGFVVTRPLFYNDKIYFGTWGTQFYALNAETGALVWKWNNGSANRMFSPAACYPVATNNKVFIVAPDRYMTVLDAENGNVIWRKNDEQNRVRESMGLSKDSSLIYAKTMEGEVIGISTSAPDREITWRSNTNLNYEIAPTPVVEYESTIYVPSNSGLVAAVKRDGSVLWKHKISNSLITSITPFSKNKIIATTMDGKVTCLEFIP
jgi:outer membrane protein assembly factor BamB/predicted MPP superfamily phosphohydrolase